MSQRRRRSPRACRHNRHLWSTVTFDQFVRLTDGALLKMTTCERCGARPFHVRDARDRGAGLLYIRPRVYASVEPPRA